MYKLAIYFHNSFKLNPARYKLVYSPAYLYQYYELLEKVYRKKISSSFHIAPESELYDQQFGQFIFALDNTDRIVGGIRLVTRYPYRHCILPLESSGFSLGDEFPEMQLATKIYSEWGRFVVDEAIEGKKLVSENLARTAVNLALQNNARYLFGAPIVTMRTRYENIFSNMGLRFEELTPSKKIPAYKIYPEVKFYLAKTDLKDTRVDYFPLLGQ